MDYKTRTHSVTAIFADRQTAESARQELFRNGFNADQVELTTTDQFRLDAASGNAGLSGHHHHGEGGGIGGFFRRLFGADATDEDRTYYSRAAERGDTALVVHADEDAVDRAADILNNSGAVDVDEDAAGEVSERRDIDDRGDRTIPVVQEEIEVGKRAVQRRGVRVHSNVTEQPVREDVTLREEKIRVDRRPADREATERDFAAADRGVIEVTETVEEPVVNKRARVVEEVVVGKEVNERHQTVEDTVRRSEVHVEGSGTTDRRDFESGRDYDYDTDFRSDFTRRYASTPDARYEDYQPAYRYGYETASDPRYRGRNWNEVENDLRSDYSRRYPNSTWERMKDSVRYGWEKVTGQR